MKEKLAIIGTGIAGMGVAHFLQHKYELTLFEKNSYIGGHSNTVDVSEDGNSVAVDTGFIVYNEVTYPNLTRLFKELNVPTKNSNMSFSVQHKPTGLEFCGSGIDGLFAQRKNFFNLRYYRLLYNINRFNKQAPTILNQEENKNLTLKEFIKKFNYHPDLLEFYLIPMSSAVWSTPINKMLDFPAYTLIRFFYNHGFLGLNTQHQWKTVVGGSRTYVNLLTNPFKDKILLNTPVQRVTRESNKVKVTANGKDYTFNKLVFA
jgi:predicted NAD/FAD-binding protein